MSNRPQRVVFGFVAAMAMIVIWSNCESPSPAAHLRPHEVESAINPQEAKRKHLFWIKGAFGAGYPADIIGAPALFDSLFPGFQAARTDSALWDFYFSQNFNGRMRSTPFEEKSADDPLVSTSWIGNLEIFRTYGADVLVVGNSETYMALRAESIAESISNRSAKVLLIVKSGAMPSTVAGMADLMAASGKTSDVVIWGYSLWGAYPGARHLNEEETDRRVLRDYSDSIAAGTFHPPGKSDGLSWERLIPRRLNRILRSRFSKRITANSDMSQALKIPDNTPLNAVGIESLADIAKFKSMRFKGIKESDCDLTAASRELDGALKTLLSFSKKVIVYLPPTTPLMLRGVPTCYPQAVIRLLRSRATSRVIVETGDWSSYGMGYADFLDKTPMPGWHKLDPNHANREGSIKVTRRISAILRRNLDPALRANQRRRDQVNVGL